MNFGSALEQVHRRTPLVDCITNFVTVNDCANITLAVGGAPVMSDQPDDAAEICRLAPAALGGRGTFVGSHPMAGSEKTGWEHARADLFVRRTVFVTPREETDPRAAERVAAFVPAVQLAVDAGLDHRLV